MPNDVPSISASNFAVASTVTDFAVAVASVELDQASGQFGARWVSTLVMSPQAAVRLAAALQQQIQAYQRAFGPIPVEALPFSDAEGAPVGAGENVEFLRRPDAP